MTPRLVMVNPNGYRKAYGWLPDTRDASDMATAAVHRYQLGERIGKRTGHSDSKRTRRARLQGRQRCERAKLQKTLSHSVYSLLSVRLNRLPTDWRLTSYKEPKSPAINRLQDVAVEVSCYQQLVMSTDKPCVFNEISRKSDSTLGTPPESTISPVSGNFGIRNQTPQR